MKFRQIIQDYFTFSRSERIGITTLLIIIFLLSVANKTIFYFETPAKIDKILLDSATHELGLRNDSIAQKNVSKTLFYFNPNTIDSTLLTRLDLPEQVKMNLLKFRSKGGEIKSKNDFRKIYGINDTLFSIIEPYLIFDNDNHFQTAKVEKNYFIFDPNTATNQDFQQLGFSVNQINSIRNYMIKAGPLRSKADFFKIRAINENQKKILSEYIVINQTEKSASETIRMPPKTLVDFNLVDSIQLKSLPGIGKVLSKRIIKYRDLLGGFYSENQLLEVYGLNEQTIEKLPGKITFDLTHIRKIDFNFANAKELSMHPYIKKNLADKIIKFRARNGYISDLSILRDSMILNISEYQRLKPYF